MKGKWKAFSQVLGGTQKYIAGRQRDVNWPLHAGNIEYSGEYTEDSAAVDALCEQLNSEEAS